MAHKMMKQARESSSMVLCDDGNLLEEFYQSKQSTRKSQQFKSELVLYTEEEKLIKQLK